jgi:hypothetical protein
MKHVLFSNYHWENDENGMDAYDYAREYLFTEYAEEEEWETEDDVPDERVYNEVYFQEECDWDNFKYDFNKFLKDSVYGFLLCGDVGTWRGSRAGGCYVNKFDDLYKFWEGCRDIKVYDERGHLYIKATHHDGTNYAELKELTCKGSNYAANHRWDSDQDVHETLWSSNFYTRLPHYAHKVWGCKKGA